MGRTHLAAGAVIIATIIAISAFVFMHEDRGARLNEEQPGAAFESYTNDEFGFRLQKPIGSTATKEGENRIKFMLLGAENSPNTEISDGFTFTVTSEEGMEAPAGLKEYAEEKVSSNRANGSPILQDLEQVTAAGMNAYRYSFKNLLDKTSTEYVFLPRRDKGYVVTYTIIDPGNKGYQEMVLKMLNSLNFTNNASTI